MEEIAKKPITNCNTDTQLIKIIAVVFMIIDHIGASIYPEIFELRILGRIAFPLFAWGLVLGCDYTKNIYLYLLRVMMLGLISQPVYMLALDHSWSELNIMFTLALSIFAIAGIKHKKYLSPIIMPIISLVLSSFINVDYGFKGVLFVILLYLSKNNVSTLFATFIAYALFWGAGYSSTEMIFGLQMPWISQPNLNSLISPFFKIQTMAWLALPFILIKTKSGIKIPKLLAYALYPMHLILIILLKYILK